MGFDSINPATGEKVNSYQEMTATEVQAILEQCADAQREWGNTAFAERARVAFDESQRLFPHASHANGVRDLKKEA